MRGGAWTDSASLRDEAALRAQCIAAEAECARLRARLQQRTREIEELVRGIALHSDELERSHARFRDVIERNADAIIVVSLNGVICFANAAAERLFGRDREQLHNSPFGFPMVAGETTELDVVRADGAYVVEMHVVESEWEGAPACIATLRDITQRRKSEEDARRLITERAARAAAEAAARAAEESNQSKSNLLAVISHDLRTPLTSIMGHVQLLEMGLPEPLPPACLERVERIRVSASHLVYLMDELLSFARLDSGHETIRIVDVDVCEVVRDVATVVEPIAAEQGLEFRCVFPAEPLPLHTDPDRLRQILLNIVGNAIRYTERGHVELAVRAPGADGCICCEVTDTGIGIRSEQLSQIYEPFWQADPTQRSRNGGTGLGLSVVRKLVELLDGRIEVESEVGRGSRFRVWLG